MHLLILGASGATGRLLTDRAISSGHEVTAFVRDPDKLEPREHLRILAGDPRDSDNLSEALAGADAVVSTLGVGNAKDPHHLIRDTIGAIVEAAGRSGTKRVVVMSAFGVGQSLLKASLPARLMYRLGATATFADKAEGEHLLTSSDLDWTIAYPPLLTSKPATGTVAMALDDLPRLPGLPRISRADVADFLLDTAVNGTFSRQIAVITASRQPTR